MMQVQNYIPFGEHGHAGLTVQNLKCAGRAETFHARPQPAVPPTAGSLVLTGDLKDQETCLGVYLHVPGCTVHGSPVWKHAQKDRWIARYADGQWLIQQRRNVGSTDICHMRLCNPSTDFPHHSGQIWEEYDSKLQRWLEAPVFQCADDPSGERALLYNKRDAQRIKELETSGSPSKFKPVKQSRSLCRDCLEDPLKGGSRCFTCNPITRA